jgi:DNA repair exonuclease SbcCD nuclease subunit
MRLLVTGDKHLGLSSDGESRLEEQRRVLARCVELLGERDPDVYVDLGDLFHSPRPGPDAYEAAFEYLRAVAEWTAGKEGRAAFVLAGNHDKPTRGMVNALSPLMGFKRLPQVLLTPWSRTVRRGSVLLFLPFVTAWEARTVFGGAAEQDLMDQAAEAALAEAGAGGRVLAFTHLEVPGAKRNEWDVTQRDVGLRIPAVLLADPRVLRVYAGHIHRHQAVGNVTVVGSAIHVDFGEAADPKGAILAEV